VDAWYVPSAAVAAGEKIGRQAVAA
jgi:hypothetical protein